MYLIMQPHADAPNREEAENATELLPTPGALAAGLGFTGPITVFFCSLWLTAAALFRRAARAAARA